MRINTHVPSMVAARVLAQQTASLQQSLMRLSTGLRINSGGDDPGGVISSESHRSEERGLSAAIENAESAKSMLAASEFALAEISSFLLELENAIDQSAGADSLSTDEVAAHQGRIDTILHSIDRIAATMMSDRQRFRSGDSAYVAIDVSAGPGIDSVAAANLGDALNGYLSSLAGGQTNDLASGNISAARAIVQSANEQVATIRSSLIAFEKCALDSNICSLRVAFENVQAANNATRETDFAAETSRLTRGQILLHAVTQAPLIYSQSPSHGLSLLK